MQESPQPPQSHFIWQPLLLVAVVIYLIAELYFLTAMVNTLDAGIRSSDFTWMEHLGRFISGAGIGLSVIIGLSMNCRMYQFPVAQRIALNALIFLGCTFAGFFAVKSLYEVIEANTSKPIVHCSVLGNAAIRVLDRGELPGFEHYAKQGLPGSDSASNAHSQTGDFSRQLVRLYLPLHICLDDGFRRDIQASDVIRTELSTMVEETRLPKKLAQPALQMYAGFREQLPRFTAEIEALDQLNGQPDKMFALRGKLIKDLDKLLHSQSRFTQTDSERIVAIYICALDTAIARKQSGAYEQRFMLAVTDCLYDRARARFKTLPGVHKGTDIYLLERAIATDWARQFVLSPQHMPEKAIDLMRQSFALVFLPTYAVFISTFVVFMCVASYFRTRFLIQAAKRNKRVNPFINAVFSPLVVVPGIWTLILVAVPEPDIENTLFPRHTHSDWVKVVKVTIRPLIHYYEYTHLGFSSVKVPLFIAPKVDNAEERLRQRRERNKDKTLEQLKGYYVGEICQAQCEPVILDLQDGNAEFAQIRYPGRNCDNRLIFDKNNTQTVTFYESSTNKSSCPTIGVWELDLDANGLKVTVGKNDREMETTLQNLYI